LSLILRGKQGLSRATAQSVAPRLGLSKPEQQIFCDLVESLHARSKVQRRLAKIRIANTSWLTANTVQLDAFSVVSDWYHFAILELTALSDFQSSEEWIAKRLDLPLAMIKVAVERLFRLGLLKKLENGSWTATDEFTIGPDGPPSELVRKFHTQILEKALSALQLQTVEERDYSLVIMGVDPASIPTAREQIREFSRGFSKKIRVSDQKHELYCLGIQFFRLTQKKEGEKK
jgi:uncharacterized protein (TIGR02147 family)